MTLYDIMRFIILSTKTTLAVVFMYLTVTNFDMLQANTVEMPMGSLCMLIGYLVLR